MTTPQDMAAEEPSLTVGQQIVKEGNEVAKESGFITRCISKLIGWSLFLGLIILTGGTITFIALALWQGIVWLWPGGGLS